MLFRPLGPMDLVPNVDRELSPGLSETMPREYAPRESRALKGHQRRVRSPLVARDHPDFRHGIIFDRLRFHLHPDLPGQQPLHQATLLHFEGVALFAEEGEFLVGGVEDGCYAIDGMEANFIDECKV